MSGSWSIAADFKAGVDLAQRAIHWRPAPDAPFPPFLYHLFGLPPTTTFSLQPESQTWACSPEPLIVYVNWDAGGRDEHFRFSNQVFSIIRVKDPNTGITTATAIYSARLTQRSGRSVDYTGGYQGPPYVPAHYAGPWFDVTLRNAGSAGLFSYADRFSVTCGANHTVNFVRDFPPALYDLVTGATWQLSTWRVARC